MAALALVHRIGLDGNAHAKEPRGAVRPEQSQAAAPFTDKLPDNVAEMREAILAAAHVGRIEELQIPIAWNEMVPDFGEGAGRDPIPYWKRTSADGRGLEILAVLANILSLAPARVAAGPDPENNAVYVWPYLAEVPLDKLTEPQEVDLLRLMPPEAAKLIRERKKWFWWRLSIGADGTWHSFKRLE
jgi:hypothetical protein